MSIEHAVRRVVLWAVLALSIIAILFPVVPVEASPRGFGTTTEEVVKLAAQEGKVRIAGSLQEKEVAQVLGGFYKKYPQITVEYTRISGINEGEKIFTEALGGLWDYDAVKVVSELQARFIKAGILAGPMDWKRVFPNIPKEHFSPNGYFAGGSFYPRVIAYNPSLVPAKRVARTWEDCLDPYWKGKFAVDVRPATLVSLKHEWGDQKILEYARKLKDNQPIWKREPPESLTQLAAGEYAMIDGVPYSLIFRLLQKDPQAAIKIAWTKIVPVSLNEAIGILKGAKNPNAAFLLVSWLASQEAQSGYDKTGRGSPFLEGTDSGKIFKKAGAKPVFAGWDEGDYAPALTEKIVSLWGFRSPGAK